MTSIQILQYEFLGPIPLSDWGPPMGKLVYLVLSRTKDRFNILYVGDCEHTDDKAFFIQHEQFKCWVEKAGSDSALHVAVFPIKDSKTKQRQFIQRRIISNYHPPCNPASDMLEKKPSYNIRKMNEQTNDPVDNNIVDDENTHADNNAHDNSNNPAANNSISSDASSVDAKDESVVSVQKPITCPCCGSDMCAEKTIGKNSILYQCSNCSMSETRIL